MSCCLEECDSVECTRLAGCSCSHCLSPDVVTDISAWVNTNSLRLNGVDSYVDFSNDGAFTFTTSFSVSAWVKLVSAAGLVALVSKSDGSTDGWILQADAGNSQWRFLINFGVNAPGNGNNDGWYHAFLAETWSDQDWHHVVGIWDSANLDVKIWVDGVEGTENQPVAPAHEGVLISNSTVNMFAGILSGGAVFMNGQIDEISIWDKALTDAEVATLYNGGVPISLKDNAAAANIMGWFRMGDGHDTISNFKNRQGLSYGLGVGLSDSDILADVP